jgi:hypothetical protein
VADLEAKSDPESPAADASVTEVMRHRLKTTAGKGRYKLRQQTVEPVFGIIKPVLGFRQFGLCLAWISSEGSSSKFWAFWLIH